MSSAEVPYRVASVCRAYAQSKGLFDAATVPAEVGDARFGRPWCSAPGKPIERLELQRTVDRLLKGELEVFGKRVPTSNGVPQWNTDPVSGAAIDSKFGLFIDFRHIGDGIDIKFLWEINRHLWWVPLAQQYALNADERCLERISHLLQSWLDACPYAQGANWASPVEHAIRLINWSIVWHLIGGGESALFDGESGKALRKRWLDSIYQHMRFASDNYSFHSSADNHLIGEAAGIFVAAHTWDRWLETRRLRVEAKAILERETLLQFGADGVNLEQATCYHKFSLQFLIASGLCARASGDDCSQAFWDRIEQATTFVASIMDCRGKVPAVGDSDDGDVWLLGGGEGFNSYSSMLAIGAALFQREDLQAKVQSCNSEPDQQVPWLNGLSAPQADFARLNALPRHFEQGGYVVLGHALHQPGECRVTFDCGALGYNRIAGHGHADALSLTLSLAGEQLLIDSGTYCYNAAPELRHFFRGSHAHNTLVVDGKDQSEYGASFLWLRDVSCTVIEVSDGAKQTVHAAHDGYRRLSDPVLHHRRVSLAEGDDAELVIEDWLECRQSHDVELLWHAAPRASLEQIGAAWRLQGAERRIFLAIEGAEATVSVIEGRDQPPQGWVSTRFYDRQAAPVLSVRARLSPRQILRTTIKRRVANAEGGVTP